MAPKYDDNAFNYFAITVLSLYMVPAGLFLLSRFVKFLCRRPKKVPEVRPAARRCVGTCTLLSVCVCLCVCVFVCAVPRPSVSLPCLPSPVFPPLLPPVTVRRPSVRCLHRAAVTLCLSLAVPGDWLSVAVFGTVCLYFHLCV